MPSPLGVRVPGKMSSGHFPVRTGRLGPWKVPPQGAEEVPGRSTVNGGLPSKPELRRAPTTRSRCLVQWFAPANRRDEGVPHRPFGPPPHCGGEALGTTSNAVQNRPHIVFLAMTREETESDDVIARRPSGRRGNPELVYLTVVSFSVDEDLFRLGFADPPPMGLTGPSSLENVHWTFSRALGPPEGKASTRLRECVVPSFPNSSFLIPNFSFP